MKSGTERKTSGFDLKERKGTKCRGWGTESHILHFPQFQCVLSPIKAQYEKPLEGNITRSACRQGRQATHGGSGIVAKKNQIASLAWMRQSQANGKACLTSPATPQCESPLTAHAGLNPVSTIEPTPSSPGLLLHLSSWTVPKTQKWTEIRLPTPFFKWGFYKPQSHLKTEIFTFSIRNKKFWSAVFLSSYFLLSVLLFLSLWLQLSWGLWAQLGDLTQKQCQDKKVQDLVRVLIISKPLDIIKFEAIVS